MESNVIIALEQLRDLLVQVQKPGRYAGGEWNASLKDWDSTAVHLALAYPDLYEIGMSNLGLAILYDLVNSHPSMLAERVYAPWEDMAVALKRANLPLFTLESRHALADFDVVGFSLQHELNYSNVLTMLELGRIPLLAQERDEYAPLIIAGGSGTYNPEPLAMFFDAFVIGEGEEVLLELLATVIAAKQERLPKSALLLRLA